jgi:hypothetical protein
MPITFGNILEQCDGDMSASKASDIETDIGPVVIIDIANDLLDLWYWLKVTSEGVGSGIDGISARGRIFFLLLVSVPEG